jgi:hypothetical protein
MTSKDSLDLEDKQEEFNEDAMNPSPPAVISTAEPTKKVKKSKDKKPAKTASGAKDTPQQRLREDAHCSFCGNSMRMSKGMNWQDIKGVKGHRGVFCDTCVAMAAKDPDRIDIKTAVVENADGSITNIPVATLLAADQ